MSSISILRFRLFMACLTMLGCLAPDVLAAEQKEYRFPIDGYELSFSVPKTFMSDYWGNPDKQPEIIIGHPGEGTRAELFFHIHMFAGPIWVGNYAALDFSVAIAEADTAYTGPVSTLEQLVDYRKWQLALPNIYGEPPDFSRKTIAGETWLVMTSIEKDTVLIRGNTVSPGKRGDEGIGLYFPLGNRRFLHVVCAISEQVPNKTGRWLAEAHKMRDQILDSVVLRKKTN